MMRGGGVTKTCVIVSAAADAFSYEGLQRLKGVYPLLRELES